MSPTGEIDFVMVRREDPLTALHHEVVAEPLASDHRPIVAALRLDSPPRTP